MSQAPRTGSCKSEKQSRNNDGDNKVLVQEEPPNKKIRLTLPELMTCAICGESKDRLVDFSKNQRSKESMAKCRTCIDASQGPSKKKRDETPEQYEARLEARKKFKEKLKEAEEQEKREANERRKKQVEANDVYVAQQCIEYEIRHKKFMEELKSKGFPSESTASSDFVYVVTSLVNGGDPCSPRLHGIYTTCEKAIIGARKAFEAVSDSYRDGKFVPDERSIFKADMSKFIRPQVAFLGRVIYESYSDEDDRYQYPYFSVAVDTVFINSDTVHDVGLTLLEGGGLLFGKLPNKKRKQNKLEGTRLYAIFYSDACSREEESNFYNLGVFTSKEAALERARSYAKDNFSCQIYEETEKDYGEVFWNHDVRWGIAMETVVCDRENENKDEIGISYNGSGLWMMPSIHNNL